MSEQTENLFHRLPNDLLAREILPLISFGQLAKVARVSKQFASVVKNTGPFSVNLFSESWLDRDRVHHLERCRNLTLSRRDLNILEHLASMKQLHLEELDVQYVEASDSTIFAQYIATILKNNKTHALKVLKLPVTDFKVLLSENVICPSVYYLSIRNDHVKSPQISTADVLKIFPSLKRISIDKSVPIDFYKYLCAHSDTKLEHVDLACDQLVADDSCVKTPLKSLSLKGSFGPSNIVQKFNTTNMKQLELALGIADEATSLPNLEKFESLKLLSDIDEESAQLLEKGTQLKHLEMSWYLQVFETALKFPQSLKSLTVALNDEEFDVSCITTLPNLESLQIYREALPLWNATKPSFATTLQRLQLQSDEIGAWSPIMNEFVNLTHLTLEMQLSEIPAEFFKICTKITHLSLELCENLTTIPSELSLLTNLELFQAKNCGLTSIPEGLKDLPHLRVLDLRNNPFTLDAVPLTLPVKTVLFTDREWIQLIQQYLRDNTKVPTVAQMLKLPFLTTYHQLEQTGRLTRVLLHSFNIPGVTLEPGDDDSNYLSGAVMRMRRFAHDNDDPTELPYLAKDVTVGIILFHEYYERESSYGRMRLVRVESDGLNKITTYSFSVTNKKGGIGWSSRAVWEFKGHIHEFEGSNGTEKEKKHIRSIVEGK